MIDTWGFSFFSAPDCMRGTDVPLEDFQQSFDGHVQMVVDAERFGFDGWAWAEHHFHPSCNAPSPHLMVAAVGARTTKLRLSVLGSVLGMHDARRLVEEIGMLDYLTHGRFEPGIAPGAGPAEIMKAGIDPSEQRARYQSGAEVLKKSIGARTITHHDVFTKVEDLQIVPPLRAELASKVWATIMSPDSAVWAAKLGFRLVTAWLPTPVVAQLGRVYNEAAQAAGNKSGPEMLGLRRRVFVAESDAQAKELHEQAVDVVLSIAGAGLETADEAIIKLMSQPDDFAIGSPETVAERLISQCRTAGFGSIMAFTDFAAFSPEVQTRSHELIGTRVAPLLKAANLADARKDAA